MPDENTVPEAPAELPATVETPVVESPKVLPESQSSPASTDSGANTSGGDLVVDANVRAVLAHVLDGFDNHSLAVGFARIAELLG